ncbi:MAG TPA: hypothetical protein VFM18_17130 [Methanosarcina sp.]|nr:hypothetical protein [Methanosarcina sp.]
MSFANLYNLRPIDPHLVAQEMEEEKVWKDIRKLAKTNPGLQDLLNQTIAFYMLSKPNE